MEGLGLQWERLRKKMRICFQRANHHHEIKPIKIRQKSRILSKRKLLLNTKMPCMGKKQRTRVCQGFLLWIKPAASSLTFPNRITARKPLHPLQSWSPSSLRGLNLLSTKGKVVPLCRLMLLHQWENPHRSRLKQFRMRLYLQNNLKDSLWFSVQCSNNLWRIFLWEELWCLRHHLRRH
jgi:hypothetical protein